MRIPIILADEPMQIPSTRGAGRQWNAIAQLSSKIFEISTDIEKKKLEQKINSVTSEVELGLIRDSQEITRQLQRNPNPDTYYQDWLRLYDEAAKKRIEHIKEPKLRASVENVVHKTKLREMVQHEAYGNRLWLATEQASLIRRLDEYARNLMLEEGLRDIEKAMLNGVLDPTVAEKLKIDHRDGVNLNKARTEINLMPENAEEILDKYDIQGEKRIFLSERAGVLVEKRERERDKKRATEVINFLKEKYGFFSEDYDYQKMIDEVRKKDFQEEWKLTAEQSISIQNILKSEWANIEYAKKKKYDETSKNFWLAFSDGTLTQDMINDAVRRDDIDWKTADQFSKGLMTFPDIVTDPAEYNSILQDMYLKKPKEMINERILSSKKLSRGDKKSLGKELWKEEDRTNDEWLRISRNFLESQIVPKRGIMERITKTPQEEADYYSAVKHLDGILQKAKEKGKPIEGSAILDAAKEITPLYQKSLAERMIEMQESLKKIPKELKELKDISKKAEKYKTAEEVRTDYYEGKLTFEEAEAILKQKFKKK